MRHGAKMSRVFYRRVMEFKIGDRVLINPSSKFYSTSNEYDIFNPCNEEGVIVEGTDDQKVMLDPHVGFNYLVQWKRFTNVYKSEDIIHAANTSLKKAIYGVLDTTEEK